MPHQRTPYACPTCGNIDRQEFVREYMADDENLTTDPAQALVVAEAWNCTVASCPGGTHTHVVHERSKKTIVLPDRVLGAVRA